MAKLAFILFAADAGADALTWPNNGCAKAMGADLARGSAVVFQKTPFPDMAVAEGSSPLSWIGPSSVRAQARSECPVAACSPTPLTYALHSTEWRQRNASALH